jgi:hypothetical protein
MPAGSHRQIPGDEYRAFVAAGGYREHVLIAPAGSSGRLVSRFSGRQVGGEDLPVTA